MYVPKAKKKKEQKKHFFQRHPVIGSFFETFGVLAWVIILVVLTSIVMLAVPDWRPIWLGIIYKIGAAWNYFWGDFIKQCISWDWADQVTPTPKR